MTQVTVLGGMSRRPERSPVHPPAVALAVRTGTVSPEAPAAAGRPRTVGDDGSSMGANGVDGVDEVFEGEIVDGEPIGRSTEIIDGESPDLNEVKIALAQRDEYLDSLRRLQAEFENYKKRVTKQQSDQMARAALSLVEKLLPVLDTLDLAVTHLATPTRRTGAPFWPPPASCATCWTRKGSSASIRSGETFDPNAHEAVGHLPATIRGSDGDRPSTDEFR